MEHTKISTDIEQNIKQFQQLFADSADIKMKEMRLGKGKRRRCFLAYIEVAVSNMLLETTALGRLLAALSELPDRDLNQVLNENAMGISDVTPYDTIEDAAQGMLTGDAILFVDGYGHALKIASITSLIMALRLNEEKVAEANFFQPAAIGDGAAIGGDMRFER